MKHLLLHISRTALRKPIVGIVTSLCMATLPGAGLAHAETLVITGGTVIDGTGTAPFENYSVLIENGRITAIGQDVEMPEGASIIDATGKFLIPGLMDANGHMTFLGLVEEIAKFEGRIHEIAIESAQFALKGGVTTVFDTAGPREPLIKAREMINAGEVPGSRLYIAGNIIGFDGPFSDDFLYDSEYIDVESTTDPKLLETQARLNEIWSQGVGNYLVGLGPEEVRPIIAEYVKKDIDYVKYASSVHDPAKKFIMFSPRVQRVIVEEAHKAGLTVQAHITTPESLDMAIEAGVDIITHGAIIGHHSMPEDAMQKMLERSVAVSVNMAPQFRRDMLKKLGFDHGVEGLELHQSNRKVLYENGVHLMMATDQNIKNPLLGLPPELQDVNGQIGEGHFEGLLALEEIGVKPMDILKIATSNIAKGYKVDKDIGSLEVGKIADILILEKNPLEKADNYRSLHTVIKDGKVVDRDALPTAPVISPLWSSSGPEDSD